MWIAHVRVFMSCFRIMSLGFLQILYDKSVPYIECHLMILFAHNISIDFSLFDQISYSAHVCTFYVIFVHCRYFFGYIVISRVFCMLCAVLLFFSRIVLAVISGYLTECGVVRMCARFMSFLHIVVDFWRYQYEKVVSYTVSCFNVVFAHSFGSDICLFDRMSYSAHTCTFKLYFCTLSLVFLQY